MQEGDGVENDKKKKTICTLKRWSKIHKYFKQTQSIRRIHNNMPCKSDESRRCKDIAGYQGVQSRKGTLPAR